MSHPNRQHVCIEINLESILSRDALWKIMFKRLII